jgi:hypothetical protein
MATVTALRKTKITVGSLIDQMQDVRSKKRALAVTEKELTGEYEALQAQLIQLMDAEGVIKSTGKAATQDWDAFVAYMVKTKQFHLIQRRVSDPAMREVFEKKGAVPGMEPYTKRVINLRDL